MTSRLNEGCRIQQETRRTSPLFRCVTLGSSHIAMMRVWVSAMTEEKARELVDDFAGVWCENHEMEYYTHEHVEDCYQEMKKDNPWVLEFDSELVRQWISNTFDESTLSNRFDRLVSKEP